MIVGMTFNLRGSGTTGTSRTKDWDLEFDSPETISALEESIRALGHNVTRIGDVTDLVRFVAERHRVDIVFNMAEGQFGRARESQVPAILEAYDLAYTFSDPLTLAVCHDKPIAKRLLLQHGLPTPPFAIIGDHDPAKGSHEVELLMPYPLFVKPVHEGTSKGISGHSIVWSIDQLVTQVRLIVDSYRQPALVEPYLPGREFTVGILGTGSAARVLGIAEIHCLEAQDTPVYGAREKEQCETLVSYEAVREKAIARDIEEVALEAYTCLECRDAGRVDVRLDSRSAPQILEVNPLPGLHPTHSDLPIIATQAGWAYDTLIAAILESANQRRIRS
jgi:D-alanine-D-alanine ligase